MSDEPECAPRGHRPRRARPLEGRARRALCERHLAPPRSRVAWTGADGTIFRVVEYQPGVAPRLHRTETIDYAVVIYGEIDMRLDIGAVHLRAGDVLVQQATIHDWVNNGREPCRVAFVLVPAKPAEIGGKALHAV